MPGYTVRNVGARKVERVMGIEPTSSAWEAEVIPLYDTRAGSIFYGLPPRYYKTKPFTMTPLAQ